jgi:hypothetical protein
MVGIPTASTSGPLRQPRSPRAVVFSGRAGVCGRWRAGPEPAACVPHEPSTQTHLRVTEQDEFS